MQLINDGDTPVHVAAIQGHTDTLKFQLDHDASHDIHNYNDVPPLYGASVNGHADTCIQAAAISRRQPCCFCSEWPNTHAVMVNHTDISRLLLHYGANHAAADVDGDTFLQYVAMKGITATIGLLLDHDASHTVYNKDHFTPLHRASVYVHTDTVWLLLDRGATM